jgi:hypothetical protein
MNVQGESTGTTHWNEPVSPFLKPDPLGVPRNPFAVYVLVLALISGVTQAVGVTASQSIESALPNYVSQSWGGMLAFGSGITLVGMYWPGAVATGLLHKRIGMLALMVACFVYSAVVLFHYGFGRFFPAGTIFGFGCAAFVQYRAIDRRVKAIIHATRMEAVHE